MHRKLFQKQPLGIRSVAGWIRGVFLSGFLFLLLLAMNVVQIGSLVLWPFNRKTFRKVNRWLAGHWWGVGVSVAQKIGATRLIVTGDEIHEIENSIVLANHQEMPDIYALMIYAQTQGRLGDLKWFVKDSLKFFPGIGWGMHFLHCVFVKRNWEKDLGKIESVFSQILSEEIPLWLVTFVEGTRITPEKVIQSQKYSLHKGLPLLNHVLLPRTKGFVASVRGLSTHVQALYDVTIAYPFGIPSLWHVVQGFVPEIHFHVKRYSISELPKDSQVLGDWLITLFLEKERFMESFVVKSRHS